MATYTYTGKLTDFGEAPFPNAHPRLWVEAREPALGLHGPLAPRRIPVTVASNGTFSVQLIASVDTVPTAQYCGTDGVVGIKCQRHVGGCVCAGR